MDAITTTHENDEAAAIPAPASVGSNVQALRIAMAAGWTVVILVLCWMPGEWVQQVEKESPWFQLPDLDKVVHWGIFVAFTVLWLRTTTSRWRYAWAGLAGLALAVISEVVQNLPILRRDGEIGDAITDLIGVGIGLVIARWIEPLFLKAESWLFHRSAA